MKTPAADSVAVLIDHLRSPAEVHVVSTDASAGAPVARTSVNEERVASAGFGEPEQFSFPGWNGETVHAGSSSRRTSRPGRSTRSPS